MSEKMVERYTYNIFSTYKVIQKETIGRNLLYIHATFPQKKKDTV